jgi:hypothetical protein
VVQKEPRSKYLVVELFQELLLNLLIKVKRITWCIELACMEEGWEEVLWAKIKRIDVELGRIDYESDLK